MNGPSIQLDRYRIAIRERSLGDLLDLSLAVIRVHGFRLLGLLLLGAVPAGILNAIILAAMDVPPYDFEDPPTLYILGLLLLMAIEAPLATAGVTLYLGQALFQPRPAMRRIGADFLGSLPQMFFVQGVVRACLLPLFFPLILFYAAWPYASEVILLERTRWFSRRGEMSTSRRIRALHAGWTGDLFVRWLFSAVIGALLAAVFTFALWLASGALLVEWDNGAAIVAVLCPIALWLVWGFFAVVRFLSYLDLRIRREGWEVELLLRAEAARLSRQLT